MLYIFSILNFDSYKKNNILYKQFFWSNQMKKIMLLTAVAAVCTAPVAAMAADNNLYGQFRWSINSVDDVTGSTIDGVVAEDNTSLFGLKGSAKKGGLTAFYHLQTGAPNDADAAAFKQRFYFAGLKGAWGKAAYGRMTNAYKFAGFTMDPFYNLSSINVNGQFNAEAGTYGLSPATNGFTDNAIQYTSPAFAGFKVNAGVYLDDGNEDDHGTNLGGVWSNKAFNVGAQYAANGTTGTSVPGVPADGSALRVYGGYKGKMWHADISYEQVDNLTDKNTSTDYIYLTGTWNVNKENRLVGSVGSVSPDSGSPVANLNAEGTGITAGWFYTVVPKTELYVSYSTASLDAAGQQDPSVLSIGTIMKFGFGG